MIHIDANSIDSVDCRISRIQSDMWPQRCADQGSEAMAVSRAAGGVAVYIDTNSIDPVDGGFSWLESNSWRC